MSISKTVAVGLAAILLSAVSAQAAQYHRRPAHHSMHASGRHGMAQRAEMRGRGSMSNSDNSADSLNAQSLTRAQGPQ